MEKVINCMRNKRVSCEKEKEKNMQHNKKTIPVFYAVDKNYLPFLAVAVASIKKYAKGENEYIIHVLYTGDLGERLNMPWRSFPAMRSRSKSSSPPSSGENTRMKKKKSGSSTRCSAGASPGGISSGSLADCWILILKIERKEL